METDSLDHVRKGVLDRMERADRLVRWAIVGSAVAEAALFAVAFISLDWDNRLERMLFLFFLLSYSIIALGLVALGGHVSRVGARILSALYPTPPS